MAAGITFDVLLDGLLNKDNNIRRQAESYYLNTATGTIEGVSQTVNNLLMYLNNPGVPERQRMLCSVLSRRLLERRSGNWPKLAAEQQAAVKAGLLSAFEGEPKKYLQQKVAHTIAEVASVGAGEGCVEWPALLTTIFSMAQSPTPSVREGALFMFSRLAEYSGRALLAPHAERLLPVMDAMLKDADNGVRVGAMQGTIALITALSEEEHAAARTASQALVPELLSVLQKALGTDEYVARDALSSLIDLLRADAVFLRPHIDAACRCMLIVSQAEAFEDATRRLGLEFMVTLAEYAGATLRKMQPFISAIITLALQFLCMVEEDPKWVTGEDDPFSMIGDEAESDSAEMVVAGASALDRIAFGVGGKTLWPLLMAQLAPMLSSPDWRQRRAAVLAVALVSEGCKKHLAPQIRPVVQGILPFMADAHPRVRHAAARCVGEMIGDYSNPNASEATDTGIPTDLGAPTVTKTTGGTAGRGKKKDSLKSIQDAAGDLILPALIAGMGPTLNAGAPRVRAICAQAAVNFTLADYCGADNLKGFESELLGALFGVLRDVGLKSAKEGAVTAVGCVAQVIEEAFVPFYPTFIAIAKDLVATCVGKEFQKLRGQALQCISLIASAVGKEVAGIDAAEMLNVIIRHTASVEEVEEDPDGYDYMVMSIVRIAGMLGADFVPYLQFVLPLLYQHANKEVEMTVLDTDGMDGEEDGEESKGMVATDVKLPNGGKRKLAINPSKLSTKLAALSGIVNLLDDLGVDVPGFFPYTEECAKAVIGNLAANFASLREMAANGLMYALLSALADTANPGKAQAVFDAALHELLVALDNEFMVEVQLVLGEALAQLLQVSYGSLTDGDAVTPPAVPVSAHVMAAVTAAAAARGAATGGSAVGGAGATPAAGAGPAGGSPHTIAVIREESLEELFETLQEMMESSRKRRDVLVREVTANPDADEEDAERLEAELEPEGDFMSHCVDAMGYAIKTHRAGVLPAIGKAMYPYLTPFLADTARFHEPMRSSAICMCDDLVEHASPEAHALMPTFLPAVLEAASPACDAFLRQAACYGLGICAQHGGAAFSPHIPAAAARLFAVVTAADAKEEANLSATENAVSALIKLARFRATEGGVDADRIMAGALGFLPFRSDAVEARLMHGWLVQALAAMDPLWIGRDGSRVSACLSALANALIAHKKNMGGAAGGAAGAGGEEEDEEEETEDALFEDASLAQLSAIGAGIRASPQAAAVAGIVHGLKKRQQAALAEFGFA